jgi:flagellar assembly protein FliH
MLHPEASRIDLFLFPENFDDSASTIVIAEPPPPTEPTFTATELAEAQAAGFDAGQRAGRAEMEASLHARSVESLAKIAQLLDSAAESAACAAEESATALAHLLLAAVGSGFPALRARYGESELRHMIAAILPMLAREPRVTVRVHPALANAVASEFAALQGPAGEALTVMADASLPLGDATILWADGQAVRDSEAARRAMTEVLLPFGLLPD